MAFKFEGTGVALVTPFKDGSLDLSALEQLVHHCIEGGVDFLVALGTTGETPVLSPSERKVVLEHVVRFTAGRVPIVAGYGGNNTQTLVDQLRSHSFEGIDGILSASPSYNKPTQEGIYQHFMALAEAAPRPIILYNVPGRTASNMTAATTLRLAQASPKFVAIKEASGNLQQVMHLLNSDCPDDFAVLSGDDNLTLPMLACGAHGLISVVANAYPKYSQLVRAARQGDLSQARMLHYQYLELVEALFKEGNPAGVKYVLSKMGIGGATTRLPLVGISDALKADIDRLMEEVAAHSSVLN